MAIEIERKFFVKGEFLPSSIGQKKIQQGYLSAVPERTVRIRIQDGKGFLTIKGIGSGDGISRYEWEKSIALHEAQALLALCEKGIIEKTRYLIPEDSGLTFEVDVFEGLNHGLIIAEIELPSADHPFRRPDWLGEEVTGDLRYYNAALTKHPFTRW